MHNCPAASALEAQTNYPCKAATARPVANYLEPGRPSKPKQTYGLLLAFSPGNACRDRKNETGAGVAQARPVIRPVFPRRRIC